VERAVQPELAGELAKAERRALFETTSGGGA